MRKNNNALYVVVKLRLEKFEQQNIQHPEEIVKEMMNVLNYGEESVFSGH